VRDEAVAAWRTEPRITPGGQSHYSALAISTALTMGMVFRLALRQTKGLIGSVIGLLGLDLAVPDHSTLSRRAKTLEVPHLRRAGTGPLHLLVDSTGLKLGGAGEWLVEKHGTSRRRSWRKLHIGVDAARGEIVAVAVTRKDIDDAAMADALLGQIADPIASFTADGGYDQDQVRQAVASRHPDALWGIYFGHFAWGTTSTFFLTWFPTYLVTYRHLDFIKAGLYASLPFIGAFLGVLCSGALSDWLYRRGFSLGFARKTPIIGGLALSTSIVGANFVDRPALILMFLSLAFFANGLASIHWSLVSATAPERLIGLTSGMFNGVGGLAGIAAPIIIGLLLRGGDFTLPLTLIACIASLGACSYIFVVGKLERVARRDRCLKLATS
jgi:hypothetical protein